MSIKFYLDLTVCFLQIYTIYLLLNYDLEETRKESQLNLSSNYNFNW